MSLSGSDVLRTRSRLGVAARRGDPEQITEAKRDHAAAKLTAYIEQTVAAAPPLTSEQRGRLATLLTAGGHVA